MIRRCLNGETHMSKPHVSYSQYITVGREPGEMCIRDRVNGMMEELNITVPVALHLDHGSYEACYKLSLIHILMNLLSLMVIELCQ